MDDPEFLGYFWTLGSTNGEIRNGAVYNLINALKTAATSSSTNDLKSESNDIVMKTEFETNNSRSADNFQYRLPKVDHDKKNAIFKTEKFITTLEYTVNRLIHGLSSGRDCVRLGYATALTALLREYSSIITLTSIAEAVHRSTSTKKVSTGDQKEYYLGRIFGYGVVAEAGYFKSTICLPRIQTAVMDLNEIFDRKVYFQDAAAQILSTIAIHCETHSPGVVLKMLSSRFTNLFDSKNKLQLSADHTVKHDFVAPFGSLNLYFIIYRYLVGIPGSNGMYKQSGNPLCRDPLFCLDTCLTTLSHPSVIWCLHPKIPSGWQTIIPLILQRSPDQAVNLFSRMLNHIDQTFFIKGKTDSSVQGATIQQIFYGFRIMLEILCALKVDALREIPSPALSQLCQLYWKNCNGFYRQLIFHSRSSSSSTSLKGAALLCLNTLAEIIKGSPCTTSIVKKSRKQSDSTSTSIINLGLYPLESSDFFDQTKTIPIETLISSPFPENSMCWDTALETFTSVAIKSTRLDKNIISRIVDITIYPRSISEQETFLLKLLEPSHTMSQNEWLWLFELGANVICNQQLLTVSSRGTIATLLLLRALGTLLLDVDLKTVDSSSFGSNDVILLSTKCNRVSVEITTLNIKDADMMKNTGRQLLSRIGSTLGRVWTLYLTPIQKLSLHMKNGGSLPIDKLQRLQKDAIESCRSFIDDFFSPMLLGLYALFDGSNKTLPKKEDALTLFQSLTSNNLTSFHPKVLINQTIKAHLLLKASSLECSHIQTCLSFGILLVDILNRLYPKLLNIVDNKLNADMILSMCITLMSFGSMIIHPFLLNSYHDIPTDSSIPKDVSTDSILVTDSLAIIDLLHQIGQGVFSDFFKHDNLNDINVLKNSLNALIDVVPSLLQTNQQKECLTLHLTGIEETAHAVSNGLLSTIFTTVWRQSCSYASHDCITSMIEMILKHHTNDDQQQINDQIMNDSESTDQEGNQENDQEEETDDEDDAQDTDTDTDDDDDDTDDDMTVKKESGLSIESNDDESDISVIDVNDAANFLLNEDLNELAPILLSKNDLQVKLRRNKNHALKIQIQLQFRYIDLILDVIQSKLNELTTSTGPQLIPYDIIFEIINWLLALFKTFKLQLNRVLRQSRKELTGSKKEAAGLYTILCKKIETLLIYGSSKLLGFLGRLNIVQRFVIPTSIDTCFNLLKQLQILGDDILVVCSQSMCDTGRIKTSQSLKCQEIGATLLLIIGKYEEILFLSQANIFGTQCCIDYIHTIQHDRRMQIANHKQLGPQHTSVESTDVCTITIQSSGCIFLDLLIESIYSWGRKPHGQITERFFRSLATLTSKYLTSEILLGFLIIPLIPISMESTKLFICREAIAVHSELQLLFLKGLSTLSDPNYTSLISSSLCTPMINALIIWEKKSLHGTIAPSAVQAFMKNSLSLLPNEFQNQTSCIYDIVANKLAEALLFIIHVLQINSAKEDHLIPYINWKIIQKGQRVGFEHQLGLAVKRYNKIIDSLSEKFTNIKQFEYLKTICNDAIKITNKRTSYRRKRPNPN